MVILGLIQSLERQNGIVQNITPGLTLARFQKLKLSMLLSLVVALARQFVTTLDQAEVAVPVDIALVSQEKVLAVVEAQSSHLVCPKALMGLP
jgi:hypothetical protein